MNMSIIAASRLRESPLQEPNVFINGIGGQINTVDDLFNNIYLLNGDPALATNLQNNGKDISFHYDGKFNGFGDSAIGVTDIFLLGDVLTSIFSTSLDGSSNTIQNILVPKSNFSTNFQALKNLSVKNFYAPLITTIGDTVANDEIFQSTNNLDFICDNSLSTINSGSPDGDIIELINNQNGTVTYSTDKTAPPAATISSNTIGGTYVELNVSQPTHVNTLKYALVFVDGFFQGIYDINSAIYAISLQQQTIHDIKVIIADEYFNISPYSNTINVTTILKSNYTISADTIGGTYVLLDENYISPIEAKTVEVYANGVLNNTITNAGKGGVYALNLDEQTNYNIYLVIEGNQSNTINVTTTTTPALFQNAVAYYKLDETRGDAIDVVNNYNGTLFGGVTQGVAGKIGNAYEIDGVTGSVVELLDAQILDYLFCDVNNQFSLRIWFDVDTTKTTQGYIIGYGGGTGTAANFAIFKESNSSEIKLVCRGAYTTLGTAQSGFNYVAFSWDGIEAITNFNGLDIISNVGTRSKQTGFGNDKIIIGNRPSYTSSQQYKGIVDEVSLWNNSLTLGEISDDYNSGNGTTI